MKTKLSILALALLQAGMANANGFDLSDANTKKVRKTKWQCKRCEVPAAKGIYGLSAVWTENDDKNVANAFGEDSEDAAALQADMVYPGDNRIKVNAHNLGLETGSGNIQYKSQGLTLGLDYLSQLKVDADNAVALYGFDDEVLTELTGPQTTSLEKKREQWQLNSKFKQQFWSAYLNYQLEEKTGKQVSSTQAGVFPTNFNRRPANFVKPLDTQTQTIQTGAAVKGKQWNASVHYQASLFENDYKGINSADDNGTLQSGAPENEAHQITAKGQYRFNAFSITGQLSKGWLYQDQDYYTLSSVPNGITHLGGEVKTTDGKLLISAKPIKGLRLRAQFNYLDRDNQTPERTFIYDRTNRTRYGATQTNVALDREKQRYLLDARYRLDSQTTLIGGYEYEENERSHSVRETTEEDRLFAKVSYRGIPQLQLSLEGEVSERDGSTYDSNRYTSEIDNPLLRKFHLADKESNKLTANASYSATDNLNLDLSARYSDDDYTDTEIGLTGSQDTAYDLAVNYNHNNDLSFSLYGGQQWIDSDQSGSQLFTTADWMGETEDSFSHIGMGSRYSNLLDQKLSLTLSYDYSESKSETAVTGQSPFGDYTAWQHKVALTAQYQINKTTLVEAGYRYIRVYDTDYTEVAPLAIDGLVTLGDTDNNFQAHQLMLTLSYAL
ncbi:MtrB/PioB family decaheme-associated outer membrane protein [Shewanella sp. A14]